MQVNTPIKSRFTKENVLTQGSTVKLEELYDTLHRYCTYLAKNKWDGEDLAQEAFYKAMKYYKGRTELTVPLLKRIAHNAWMDVLRKTNRELVTDNVPENEKRTEMDIESTLALIEELSQQLTTKQLIIFTLREAFQYQTREVAEILGMTETAVKALVYRTRERLEKIYKMGSKKAIRSPNEDGFTQELVTKITDSIQFQDPSILLRLINEYLNVETSRSAVLFHLTEEKVDTPKMHLHRTLGITVSNLPSRPLSRLSLAA